MFDGEVDQLRADGMFVDSIFPPAIDGCPKPFRVRRIIRRHAVFCEENDDDIRTNLPFGCRGDLVTFARNFHAIDRFVGDCKAANLWSKLIEVGPFAGSNLNAAMVKLAYQPAAGAVLTNSNFVSNDFVETGASGGLTSDGTKFLNTNVPGSTLPDTGHLGFYLSDDVVVTGNRAFLGVISGSDHYWMGALNPTAACDARYGGSITASSSDTMTKGFYVMSREADTSLTLYRNATSIATAATSAPTTKSALPVYVWALYSSGASCRLPARGAFYSIGQALNATEVTALNAAVRNLQLALNRAVN